MLALRTSGPEPKLRDGLEAIRAANGTNINPFNLRLLPLLPRDMIVRRLQRHQRNVEIVQRELGRPVRVLGDGGLAFVDTPEPQVAVDLLQLLCLDRRCRVAQGTSFGLNRTRVCVPPNGSESIRVACGIEDELTIITQSELLRLALRVSTLKEIQADLPSFKAHFPDFPAERYPNPASRASFATAVESFCRRLREFVEGPRSDPKGA